MNEDYSDFQKIVQNSPFLSEKWAGMVAQVQADGEKYYGVKLSESDVLQLGEVRLAALGDGVLDRAEYEKQLHAHSAFREVIQLRRVAAGDIQAQAESVLEVLPIRNRADRISAARNKGVASVGQEVENSGLSKADALQLLLTLPHSQRLALARKMGLA